jgi:glycosyltransferase involved in cell wall biosynthesis
VRTARPRRWFNDGRHSDAPTGQQRSLKLRIAISTPAYPLPGDPTRGRYIYEIARCLGKLATVEVFFHTGRYPRLRWLRPRSFVPTNVTSDLSTPDVKVTAFDYPSFPIVSRAVNGYVSGQALLRRLKPFEPDVVLGYWIYPEGYGAWRCAQHLGIPCVLGGLGTDIRACVGLTRWFSGRVLRAADQLIMVSEEMRRLAIERFGVDPARVHAITNGVNTSIFHPRVEALMRRKLGLPGGARIILYVGRFVVSKGLRELLEAFAALAAQDSDLHLVLIGDGVIREELRARVATAPWGVQVYLPGAMQPEAIAEWIGAADLLCLPSYSEGYPNVVVEALASGRPVVATDVGGIPELVNITNGRLVPPRDAVALQIALAEAIGHAWDQQAIAAAWSRSWDDVARATLAVCQQACRGDT